MKKLLLLILSVMFVMTSCTSLFNVNEDRNGRYSYETDYRNGHQLPPPDDRHGNKNGNYYSNPSGNHYNYGYYNNDRHNGNYYARPDLGTMVTSLGVRNPRTIKVNGETIYDVNNVYYKAVRTSAGIRYQVVGYTNR